MKKPTTCTTVVTDALSVKLVAERIESKEGCVVSTSGTKRSPLVSFYVKFC